MRPARYAGALVALVVLAGSVVLSVSVPLRSEHQFWLLTASFVPWALLGYLVATGLHDAAVEANSGWQPT